MDRIVAAARATGAEAIHPGYGFLAENAAFARALRKRGDRLHRPELRGPRARRRQGPGPADHGEGRHPDHPRDDSPSPRLATNSGRRPRALGYPVMVKASAGGGGKGMRVVRAEDGLGRGPRSRPAGGQIRLRRRFGLSREMSSRSRATSSSRSWPTTTATPSISSSGNARSRAATRRSSRNRRRPALDPALRASDGRDGRPGDAGGGLQQRRDGRIPPGSRTATSTSSKSTPGSRSNTR